MNSAEEIRTGRRVMDMTRAGSILLLLLHYYYYFYAVFGSWGLTADISGKILLHIEATGLFNHPLYSKAGALLLLILSLLGSQSRKDEKISLRSCGWIILAGLVLYFGSSLLQAVYGKVSSGAALAAVAIACMSISSVGWLLLLTGGVRLSRIFRSPLGKEDPFGRQHMGFPQEEQLTLTEYSINLPAQYLYKGEIRDSWINFINPRRGILILGSPGSGKSWFIIEPAIRQLMEKGFALFIYDYKYDALTRLAYHYFLTYRDRYPKKAAFFSINFSDLHLSHRCNVLHPATMGWISDALGASRTILLSMNRNWITHQGDFFVESPINFVGALIWYLRRYKDGLYCTLPHVIELAQVAYEPLLTLLNTEPEIQTLVNPFVETFRNESYKLLDSQLSSAKIPLGRLASPDLYYILTGDDCNLDINDPLAPKVLCLGGDPARQEALAPVLSLFIDRLNKRVNQRGKYPCALVCDEFATVRAYSMAHTIATARSNNIIPILAVQDLNQLRIQYSRDEADLFLNMTGNLLCGQVGGETARWVSERFPKVWQDMTSINISSTDTSINKYRQWETAISPATLATLSSGEFLGIVADDPGREMELKAFHARLRKEAGGTPATAALPVIRKVDGAVIQEGFLQVRRDIQVLVSAEMERIYNDADLIGLVVKRERKGQDG